MGRPVASSVASVRAMQNIASAERISGGMDVVLSLICLEVANLPPLSEFFFIPVASPLEASALYHRRRGS